MKYKGYDCTIDIDSNSCHLLCSCRQISVFREFNDKIEINEVVHWFRDSVDIYLGRKIDPSIISDNINHGIKPVFDREIIGRKMREIGCPGDIWPTWDELQSPLKSSYLDAADAIIAYIEEVLHG